MTIKRYVFLIFLGILISASCVSPLQKLQAVKLKWILPIVDIEMDTVFIEEGNNKLYFSEDVVLYEIESIFIHTDNKQEKIYTYWIYKSNHKQGIRYETMYKNYKGLTFDVDSFLVENAFKTVPFYSKENDIIFSKQESSNKKEVIEKYISKSKPDYSYPDTLVFFYNKTYKDVPFSFSPVLEGKNNSRLVEVKAVYNPLVNSKNRALQKGREMIFQIEKIPIENQQEKMLYFEKFKKDSKRLNLH